jgi:hypothetical protein
MLGSLLLSWLSRLLGSRQSFSRPLLGCRHGCLLRAGRAFLRRHGFKASLAADLAALPTDLAHDLGKQCLRFLVHSTHLKTV